MGNAYSLKEWQERVHAWAIRKQWRDPENIGARPPVVDCALFVTEVSEAVEELRKNGDPAHKWYSYTLTHNGVKFENLTQDQYVALSGHNPDRRTGIGKPEGFGPELADVLIRIFDTAEEHGLDLDALVEEKMEYNETREIKHGGKLL